MRVALEAVARLEEIYEIMKTYGYEKYISFDFGMLSKYQYYTGIIFQAYTYGTGEPMIKGGRYNGLMSILASRQHLLVLPLKWITFFLLFPARN